VFGYVPAGRANVAASRASCATRLRVQPQEWYVVATSTSDAYALRTNDPYSIQMRGPVLVRYCCYSYRTASDASEYWYAANADFSFPAVYRRNSMNDFFMPYNTAVHLGHFGRVCRKAYVAFYGRIHHLMLLNMRYGDRVISAVYRVLIFALRTEPSAPYTLFLPYAEYAVFLCNVRPHAVYIDGISGKTPHTVFPISLGPRNRYSGTNKKMTVI
jgi:hypothetical protein